MFLPLHLLCLRDMGLMPGEYWDLTALVADCATDGVYEFQLVAPPLRFVGAVGSPMHPIDIKRRRAALPRAGTRPATVCPVG